MHAWIGEFHRETGAASTVKDGYGRAATNESQSTDLEDKKRQSVIH